MHRHETTHALIALARVATVRMSAIVTAVKTHHAGARKRTVPQPDTGTTCGFIADCGVRRAGSQATIEPLVTAFVPIGTDSALHTPAAHEI
jgi:hypothetical protein